MDPNNIPSTLNMDITNRLEEYKMMVWYQQITVEPTMFFYMMAYMITNVCEQAFYIFQTCRVDHGYDEEICYNISEYKDINIEVQATASTFHQWNGVAGHVVPFILAFFLGSYSDKRGRKFIILAGLCGKLFFSFMVTINTMFYWPVNYIIYTATLPSAFTATDLAIFAGCFAYIADVTTMKNRTLRVGILDIVYLSAMPTGVALGNFLYTKVVNRSFTAMFAINTALMVVATVYSFLNLEWQTRPEQKSLKQAQITNPVTDFLEVANIKATLQTLTKKRPNRRRLFLWLLLVSMAFYVFQRDERQVMYMYTSAIFEWDMTTFSHFRTYLSVLYVLAMLVGIPVMTKLFRWRDTIIVMIGATAHICGHLIYAQAQTGKWMYVGASVAALGPCVAPLIRSMTSKVLPPGERGVAYAFLAVMENAVAMFTSVIYSQLYKATLNTNFMNAVFYLTLTTQVFVFISALTMDLLRNGQKIEVFGEKDLKMLRRRGRECLAACCPRCFGRAARAPTRPAPRPAPPAALARRLRPALVAAIVLAETPL